jgi:hypothetical protein
MDSGQQLQSLDGLVGLSTQTDVPEALDHGDFTFHRIKWWTNGPQMVQAAHTVISCFSMTFEQRQIV